MLRVVIPVLSLFLVAGCGVSRPGTDTKKTTRITQEQIKFVMNNQNFDCASIDGATCPQGVSRLLTINPKNPDKSSVCSGFMVGPNTLVTNNHCVSNLEACKNTHIAVTVGKSYYQTKCKEIVYTKLDYKNPNDPRRKIDVTIIKTADFYPGEVMKLAKAKVSAHETVSTWVIDHTGLEESKPNLFNFRITQLHCKVSDQKEMDSLILSFCPVISGNSGSPVTNEAGEIIGIIWGSSKADTSSAIPLGIRRSIETMASVTLTEYFEGFIP